MNNNDNKTIIIKLANYSMDICQKVYSYWSRPKHPTSILLKEFMIDSDVLSVNNQTLYYYLDFFGYLRDHRDRDYNQIIFSDSDSSSSSSSDFIIEDYNLQS